LRGRFHAGPEKTVVAGAALAVKAGMVAGPSAAAVVAVSIAGLARDRADW
jgi:hypothetical protein